MESNQASQGKFGYTSYRRLHVLFCLLVPWSLDSTLGVRALLCLGRPKGRSVPGESRIVSHFQNVHTGSGDHPVLYEMGAGVPLLGLKRPEREEDHSPQYIADVRGGDIPPIHHIRLKIARCSNSAQWHLTITVPYLEFPFYSPRHLLLSSFRVRFCSRFTLLSSLLVILPSLSVSSSHLYCLPCFVSHSFPSVLSMLHSLRHEASQ